MHGMLARPRLALALLLLLVLGPGPLLLKVKLDNAPEAYFPEDAPAVVFDRELRQTFPQDQVLVALFQGEALYGEDFLTRLDGLVKTLEAEPAIDRVLAVTTVDQIRATIDGFRVETLIDVEASPLPPPEVLRKRVREDIFAPGLLASEDGDALALVIRPHPMDSSLDRLQLEGLLRDSVREAGLEPQLAAVAGHVALDVAQLRAMITDLATLIPGTLGVSLLLLWLLFRRVLVLVIATATISAVTGLAMGLLILLGKPFTLISAIIPPLLTALTVAMLMHLFNAILHASYRGYSGAERMRAALDAVAYPILFTALTTAAGLISLMVSPIRPIAAFGLVAAVGVLLGAGIVVLLLPAIIVRWDRQYWSTRGHGMRWLDRLTTASSRLALRRPAAVLVVATLLLAAAIPQIPRIQVETDLYSFFLEKAEITRATRLVESELSGVMALEVVFDGPDFDSLMDPDRLRAIARVQDWLDERPEVDYSLSLPDLIAEMHWAFNSEDPAFRRVPDNGPLIAQYLFIYDGSDLFELVDRDFTRTRLVLNLNAHGAGELNALMRDLDAELAANPPADLTWDYAGMGRLFADQERLLIQGQIDSVKVVVVLVLILMLVMWRSPSLALVSMVPNLAPVVLIFALMAVLGIWLDMATAMVASVAVGIALDDTIHVLHGYQAHRRAGCSTTWAIARVLRQRGRAVIATTLVLVAQFLLLAASGFQPTSIFGWLTAFGLIVALVFDLLVLPAILAAAGERLPVRRRSA
jgi:predicted RND superfamily exporter protein